MAKAVGQPKGQTKPEYLASQRFFQGLVARFATVRDVQRNMPVGGYPYEIIRVADRLVRSGAIKPSDSKASVADPPRPAKSPVSTNSPIKTVNDLPPDSLMPPGEADDVQVLLDNGKLWNVSLPKTTIKTLDELLDYCQADLRIWDVDRFEVKKWDGMIKNADNRIETKQLFAVRATFKKKVVVAAAKSEIDALVAEARSHAYTYPKIAYPRRKKAEEQGASLLEISIPDLHMGKLAWKEECGDNYDVNIAESLFNTALSDLVKKTSCYDIDRICFVVGNDLLNSDNPENTTTRGTAQTTDGRHVKTFRRTRQMIVAATEQLMQIAPVDVVMVPGNHDQFNVFVLGEALDCWFHRSREVSVDNRACLRKYYRYGANMLLFTHGSEEKPYKRLSQIAAAEEPRMWGETSYREAHIGHLHKTMVDETCGFRVRMLPSLCAPEDWHAAHGYVGNVRSAEALVWSKQTGLVGTAIYNMTPSLN